MAQKKKHHLYLRNAFLIFIGFCVVIFLGILDNNPKLVGRILTKTGALISKPTPTPFLIPTIRPTSTPSPTIIEGNIRINQIANQPIPTGIKWGDTIKKDELTSESWFGADSRMATPAELNDALNQFRVANGVGPLNISDTLCRIAQTRANELQALGHLDNHDGFYPLYESQNEFWNMGENIGGGHQPNLAVHIIEWGWGKSVTGHREQMLRSSWTHGCGGVAGYFVTFEFGSH